MPKGKHVNHKGRNRRFTNPEELEEQRKQEEKAKIWRKHNNIPSSDEDKDDSDNDSKSSKENSDDETDEDESGKAKGVEGLITIENPNRIQQKMKKLSTIDAEAGGSEGPKLTRREREELEKQRAAQHYQKLHAEGKTDEARADLARLAIIRQQREEAAKKREEERKERELAKQSKTLSSLKAIKKR